MCYFRFINSYSAAHQQHCVMVSNIAGVGLELLTVLNALELAPWVPHNSSHGVIPICIVIKDRNGSAPCVLFHDLRHSKLTFKLIFLMQRIQENFCYILRFYIVLFFRSIASVKDWQGVGWVQGGGSISCDQLLCMVTSAIPEHREFSSS